jgi:DNA-binding GntR family transcriptional regulator
MNPSIPKEECSTMTSPRESAEERAYRSIIGLILSGRYRPGDFLLELDLAPQLGMSRTPVSRALARLISEGFLSKMPKKGSFIPLPTPEDASQVFFAREAVEGQAAAAAALHATPEEVEALRRYIAGDEEAVLTRSREQFSSNNELLHLGIARASRNTYLEKWCRNIFWRSNVYVFYFDGFYRPDDAIVPQKTPEQHAAILDAIAARDPEKAADRMRAHIRRTFEALLLR